MKLTAIVLTLNEADNIAACIETLRFADDILVLDSYSRDRTVLIAQQSGARVVQRAFDNYADQRNAALELVKDSADWALFVDADERVTSDLAEEIREAINFPGYAGFRIPRHNYIFGRLTLGAGWYPDYQTRLLRIGLAHYDPARKVHEIVVLNGREGTLTEPLIHYNYSSIGQFIEKQRRYTETEARILFEQGLRPKPHHFLTQPIRHFIWRFFTLRGYRDGLHGLRLSLLMAWYEFRKQRLLQKMWA